MKSTIFRVALYVLAFAAPAFAVPSFELPEQGLERRVEFWKKVFTQYGKDDLVIHDRVEVNLIYDVAGDRDLKVKLRSVEKALRDIQSNLETPQNLEPDSRQIYQAIVDEGIPLSPALLNRLVSDIHVQRGVKERFRDGVVRSGRYVSQFQDIMRSQGVPEELALLPLVESSFENARSLAGAVGIWQFTRVTGRVYNLKFSGRTDERLDPIKSTQAAARLLRDNQRALGAWPLAITAYNHGRGGMQRAQQELGSDITKIINDYEAPLFGYASMNFYSEFLAALEVYQDYRSYFGELVLDEPNTSAPAATPAVKAPSKAATPKAKAVKVAGAEKYAEKYKVRRGDTLWEIAQRFGTSIHDLMQKNNLRQPAVYAGQILLVK